MRRLLICGRVMVAEGVLLLAVAAIHLLVIPVLKRVLARLLTRDDMAFVWAPFLLNHAVVGVLLIPLGVSTIYAGLHLKTRAVWAHRIGLLNAATVMCLPAVLFAVMDRSYFNALPFVIASVLVCVVAVSMLWPLLWVASEFRPRAGAGSGE
jgi:hypothetical protein